MVTAVSNAVFDRLMTSAPLLALVSSYNSGKAIFTQSPIPPNVQAPYIVVSDPVVDVPGVFDTKDTIGREWVRDIFCYADTDGSVAVVDEMAELVRGLFHRQHGEINVVGAAVIVARATGPEVAPTDDTLYGRVVTVTLTAAL